ncbi:hypothetical protein KIS4809_3400 [Bacillus sp. ZZV12-4809]|nr:hypothetical protein KIS4809_3400 [Bacillus sp. ZZV12-4809]
MDRKAVPKWNRFSVRMVFHSVQIILLLAKKVYFYCLKTRSGWHGLIHLFIAAEYPAGFIRSGIFSEDLLPFLIFLLYNLD